MLTMSHEQDTSQTIVLIPAYQPGRALIESTELLVAAQLTVVVVDDGSQDEYQHIFRELNKSVLVIKHGLNKGKGAALKTGYRYIMDSFQNYVIVTADADGQHHVDDIIKMAEAYNHNFGTLLLGVRTFENKDIPFRSRFGNTLTRKVFSLITRQQLSDTQTGLRAFDESIITFMIDVPGEHFEYEMNVLLACSRNGVVMTELPIATIYENNNQTSHFDPIRDSLSIYKEVFRFASSSLLAFGIDFSMFIILLHLTSSWVLATSVIFANIVSRTVSASFNFAVNRHLIFNHKGNVVKDFSHYALLAGFILLANTVLLNFMTGTLHLNPYLAKIVTELACFSVSYFVQRNIIFTHRVSPQV